MRMRTPNGVVVTRPIYSAPTRAAVVRRDQSDAQSTLAAMDQGKGALDTARRQMQTRVMHGVPGLNRIW
jgi:hypothetical protein